MKDHVLFSNDELFAFAMHEFKRGNFEDSLLRIKIIMSRGQFSSEVFALAGKVYASVQLFDQARAALTRFVTDVPEAFVELFQLGMVERDSGNEAEAEKVWLKVLEIEQHYPPALFHLGEMYLNRNETEQAKNYLNLVVENVPDENDYVAMANKLLNRMHLQ